MEEQANYEALSPLDLSAFFKDVVLELEELYVNKNADYGNSFVKVRSEYPNAVLIRLMDKLERLKLIYAKGYTNVMSETVEDTLKDMANYCIMEIMARRNKKTDENKTTI